MIDYTVYVHKCIFTAIELRCITIIIVMFVVYYKNHVNVLDTKYFSRRESQEKCADVEI
jgi:hypothetical protein